MVSAGCAVYDVDMVLNSKGEEQAEQQQECVQEVALSVLSWRGVQAGGSSSSRICGMSVCAWDFFPSREVSVAAVSGRRFYCTELKAAPQGAEVTFLCILCLIEGK